MQNDTHKMCAKSATENRENTQKIHLTSLQKHVGKKPLSGIHSPCWRSFFITLTTNLFLFITKEFLENNSSIWKVARQPKTPVTQKSYILGPNHISNFGDSFFEGTLFINFFKQKLQNHDAMVMAIRVVEFSNWAYKIRKFFSKFNNFLLVCWFLGKKNTPSLKTPQPVSP